jgi:inhibitor of cysteine peptidase
MKIGSMKRMALVGGLLCVRAALPLAAQQDPAPVPSPAKVVRSAAVWRPVAETLDSVRAQCGPDPQNLESCSLDAMARSYASPAAIAFSKSMAASGVIYLRAFREAGRVDIGYIEYVFRANELEGVVLVNGDPSPIDVDDPKWLTREMLAQNSVYGELAAKYPNISVWPADRTNPRLPEVLPRNDGGQDFLVRYLLRDGCHACAEIGNARAVFSFDANGKFTAARLQNVVPGAPPSSDVPTENDPAGPTGAAAAPGPADRSTPPATTAAAADGEARQLVHARVGEKFSITLIANHTTGYSWKLATVLDRSVLTTIGTKYEEEPSSKVGVPGEEIWMFLPKGKGTVELGFQYQRRFEKDVPPLKTAKFEVIIG